MSGGDGPPSDLDRRIDELVATAAVSDVPTVRVLLGDHPALTVAQAKRLFNLAVDRSAAADVRLALGDTTPDLADHRDEWMTVASTVREVLGQADVPKELREGLDEYWDAVRGEKALGELARLLDGLEPAIRRQAAILALHTDAARNHYRRQAVTLVAQMTGPATDGERQAAATALVTAASRYAAVIVPRVKSLAAEIDTQVPWCLRLLGQVPQGESFAHAHRWGELTKQLQAARSAAVTLLQHSVQWDRIVPEAVLGGHATMGEMDGQPTLILDAESRAQLDQAAAKRDELEVLSKRMDARLQEERLALAEQLRPRRVDDTPKFVMPTAVSSRTGRRHPATDRWWFRLAQAGWWSASLLAFGLIAGISTSSAGVWIGAGVALVVYVGVRSALLFVALGRFTLHEPEKSGMVDLDLFEQTYMSRGDVSAANRSRFEQLRQQFGQRAPVAEIQAFMDQGVSLGPDDRRRFLEEGQGKPIPIAILRTRVLTAFSHVSPARREAALDQIDLWLLQLEIKYGSDIPPSAAADETGD